MKLRRVLSTLLSVTLLFSVASTTALAKQDNNNSRKTNGGIPYGIAKKFNDLEKFPWAEQAIEKMRLKGLLKGREDGKYSPAGTVTQLETIIMAFRVMGWEDDSQSYTKLPKEYQGKSIDSWATGYVALAFEKGILDEVDKLYFNPNEPAKRHEVAKYIIRAIGYEDEAKDHMDDDLSFDDASAIPQGSVGYVYMANKLGLMLGDNNKFNPMGTFTRAEMAVLFQRLDDKVDNDIDEDEYKGKIHKISKDTITLNIDGDYTTFDISEDVSVYSNNKRINISALKINDYVNIQLDNSEVIYISVEDENADDDENIISKYSGAVTDIDDNKITVQIDKMSIIFEGSSELKVYFNDEEGSFEDIAKGDVVTVIVDSRNRAREISVDRELESAEYEGEIYSLNSSYITLTVDNKNIKLTLDDNVDITIGDDDSEYEDLEAGMQARVKVKNNKAYEIKADSEIEIVKSRIIAIKQSKDGYVFTILKDNDETDLSVSEEVEIISSDTTKKDIEDLTINQNCKFTIENGIITIIEIL